MHLKSSFSFSGYVQQRNFLFSPFVKKMGFPLYVFHYSHQWLSKGTDELLLGTLHRHSSPLPPASACLLTLPLRGHCAVTALIRHPQNAHCSRILCLYSPSHMPPALIHLRNIHGETSSTETIPNPLKSCMITTCEKYPLFVKTKFIELFIGQAL